MHTILLYEDNQSNIGHYNDCFTCIDCVLTFRSLIDINSQNPYPK